MAQINLLPTDSAPRPTVIRTSGVVRKILTVGFIIFIVAATVLAALYFFYSRDIKASSARTSELKTNIKALEVTEQRLLLVKDRLEKAKLVLGMDTTMDELEAADTLLSSLPPETTLSSAEFKVNETVMTLGSPNTGVLTRVIGAITSGGIYKNVDMTSFGFTPETGFTTEFTLTR